MSRRVFITDLLTGSFLANSRECVRIIGVILNYQQSDPEDNPRFPGFDPISCGEMVLLTLDDGTSIVTLWTPKNMIDRLAVEHGETIECIARLRQVGDLKRWYADTLMRVAENVESLRWMELCRPPSEDECKALGYPRSKVNANEAFRLICVQSKFEKSGVSADDLALAMHAPVSKLMEFITELQLNGMIYQNEEGKFVPL